MGDEYDDFGAYGDYGDFGGSEYAAYDPNSNAWDPASAYYQPTGNSWAASPSDFPSGGGAYSVGGQDWNPIYAPGNVGSAPAFGYSAPSSGGSYTDQVNANRYSNTPAMFNEMASWSRPSSGGFGGQPSGGGMPGARSVAQQSPQLISMGKPDTDLYNRYKSMLMDPSQLQQDPAYQFLFNQGQQALNRSLAARRMSLSGNAMNDTMAYGAGTAAKYFKDMIPQYQAGAREELNRFMGPAGLLPRYAASNNATISGSNQMVNNADDRAMYRNLLSQPDSYAGGGDWGSGIGYGGAGSRYMMPPPPSAPSRSYGVAPRLMNYEPFLGEGIDSGPYEDAAGNAY